MFVELTNLLKEGRSSEQASLLTQAAGAERRISTLLAQYGGEVIKLTGDALLVLFQSATDAVRASLVLMDTFHDASNEVRVGVATGDVEVIAGDVFGEVVNLASRILSTAPLGQAWFSPATLLCMNQTEVAWESVGHFTLKGIAGETELLRAVPPHRAWFPDELTAAILSGTLVRIHRGASPPRLPPDCVILLEGFESGSPALESALSSLPVVDPARIWLCTYQLPATDRIQWQRSGRGLLIASPEGFRDALSRVESSRTNNSSTDTIIFDSETSITAELMLAGLALPAVPLSDVVAGYTYNLQPDGHWVSHGEGAVAQVDVTSEAVMLRPYGRGLNIDGHQIQPGESITLRDGMTVTMASGTLVYRSLEHDVYVGLLLSDTAARIGMVSGLRVEVGREPQFPGLALPDRRGQENIRWCPGYRAARARSSGFTMDRALAGRRQAAIHLTGDNVVVTTIHPRCPTYLVTAGRLALITGQLETALGSLFVMGTSVVAARPPQ